MRRLRRGQASGVNDGHVHGENQLSRYALSGPLLDAQFVTQGAHFHAIDTRAVTSKVMTTGGY
jgi:hypothetical protein